MRWLAALMLLLGVAVSTASAQTSPADALRNAPKKVAIADLPESYRAVSFGTSDFGGLGIYGLVGFAGGSSNTPQNLELISLIGAVLVDPDEFGQLLEGKKPRIRGYVLDLTEMMRTGARRSDDNFAPSPVFMETWIEGGRVLQWSPRPGVSRESLLKVFSAAPSTDESVLKAKDLSNVKQVTLGMMMYAGDYDDVFPYADSTAKAKNLVMPYTKNEEIWLSKNPSGGRILYNTSLSRVSSTAIARPDQTLLVWGEMPWPDGGRSVGYADGHAKYLSASEWQFAWAEELSRRGAARNHQFAAPGVPLPAGVAVPAMSVQAVPAQAVKKAPLKTKKKKTHG